MQTTESHLDMATRDWLSLKQKDMSEALFLRRMMTTERQARQDRVLPSDHRWIWYGVYRPFARSPSLNNASLVCFNWILLR